MSKRALYSHKQQGGMGLLGSVVLAAGVMVAGFLMASAVKDFRKYDQFIEVRGLAEELVKSDKASWNLSFSVLADTPQAAGATWTKQLEKLESLVLGMGFEASDIRRQPVTIFENVNPNGAPVEPGKRWRAQGGFVLETAKVDAVEQASLNSDVFLNEGILVESSFIQFYFTDLNSIKPRMLKAATDNAKEAAQTFAADSGVKVGALKTATQGLFSISAPLGDYGGENSVMKKIRVVTKVQYLVE
ncbi:MAG: SIMPL domain-containing protein [Limnobacter sp.]|jgi:uncharacterized protein|uniref:SIMPL domain-containing protein n=1 Tax=Limnobacter sp. TaxID=2003368 RepID=UPI0030012633